jgi:hypothetical protein
MDSPHTSHLGSRKNSRHTKENWIPNSWILAQLKAEDY